MFQIESRYEHWAPGGAKLFTKWFTSLGGSFQTKEEAEQRLEKEKEDGENVTKVTKMRYEFRVVEK